MPKKGSWLASTTFEALYPDGTRRRIVFRIGVPHRTQEPGEWACPVALEGLVEAPEEDGGADAVQALCLSLSWAGRELRALNESGVVLVDPSENIPFTWNDYFDLDLEPNDERLDPGFQEALQLLADTRAARRKRK